MNERTVKISHGWRREKRRKCSLIRKNPSHADDPETCLVAPDPARDHGVFDLAKCLRVARCQVRR